jgi:hypothetical protein
MIEKESIHASQAVIVQVMNNRNPQLEGQFIDSGGHRWEDVVDKPIFIMPSLLVTLQLLDDAPIVVGLQSRDTFVKDPTGECISA